MSEEQFERLRPKVRGVARVDDRRVISGIIHVVKSGGRWVDVPACYGPRKMLCPHLYRRCGGGKLVSRMASGAIPGLSFPQQWLLSRGG